MDFALNEEQQLLKDTARRFLEKECSKTLVRELQGTREGYSVDLWRRVVDLGWLGLPLPEEHGGTEASFLDLAVVLEEMGRALLPGPFCPTVLLGAYPIMEAGSPEQKAEILNKVAEGKAILTMAFLETGAAYDPADVTLVSQREGNEFVLNGTKLFVPDAHIADIILTLVRTEPGDGFEGASILLVDAKSPGLKITVLPTIDKTKLCEVVFENVRVSVQNLLGEQGRAGALIERTLARAAIAECLQMVGGAQLALEMSVEHAKNRVQFGQPVGAFQAVQHLLANLVTDLDGARFLTYQAAWRLSEGMSWTKEVAIAKAWVSNACNRAVANAHQVHGGVGFIEEHDLPLHFRRTTAAEIAYGGPHYHYNRLADALSL